jgi:signal transduction histidine kinase
LEPDTTFARLVSLACHDLRTPLATIHGFARTMERSSDLPAAEARYTDMIVAAAMQMAELLEELQLAASMQAGRYEPRIVEVDSRSLADAAAETLGQDRVGVDGRGAGVLVDPVPARRAVSDLTRCALRHGGLERVELHVDGPVLELGPVTPASAPVLLGDDLRDLGAAVAVRALRAMDVSVELAAERLSLAFAASAQVSST